MGSKYIDQNIFDLEKKILERMKEKREHGTKVWIRIGGGTWLGPTDGMEDPELISDTQYENPLTGDVVEFHSTPDLRYDDFFPDEMSQEEWLTCLESLKDRKDVKIASLANPD